METTWAQIESPQPKENHFPKKQTKKERIVLLYIKKLHTNLFFI
jgi:hypothetical protein